MKVLVNGGLNLSELDGWWEEAYDAKLGWAIGDRSGDLDANRDDQDAEELYTTLEGRVLPEFYARDAAGIPRAWLSRVRASMASLTPAYSSTRVICEDMTKAYLPAARSAAGTIGAWRRGGQTNGNMGAPCPPLLARSPYRPTQRRAIGQLPVFHRLDLSRPNGCRGCPGRNLCRSAQGRRA